MKIALDFDDTYTLDQDFWNDFIDNAKAKGHDIRIVTFRKKLMADPALEYLSNSKGIPVIFTEYIKKRLYCRSIQFFPDIWIDDSPEFIVGE